MGSFQTHTGKGGFDMPGMTGCAMQGGTITDGASEVPHCHTRNTHMRHALLQQTSPLTNENPIKNKGTAPKSPSIQ